MVQTHVHVAKEGDGQDAFAPHGEPSSVGPDPAHPGLNLEHLYQCREGDAHDAVRRRQGDRVDAALTPELPELQHEVESSKALRFALNHREGFKDLILGKTHDVARRWRRREAKRFVVQFLEEICPPEVDLHPRGKQTLGDAVDELCEAFPDL